MTENFCSYQPVNSLCLAAHALASDLLELGIDSPALDDMRLALAKITGVRDLAGSDFGQDAIDTASALFQGDDIEIDDVPFIAAGETDGDGSTACWVSAWLHVRVSAEVPRAPAGEPSSPVPEALAAGSPAPEQVSNGPAPVVAGRMWNDTSKEVTKIVGLDADGGPVVHELQGVSMIPSAEELDEMFNPKGGGEHPGYPREEWRHAVANEDTISGYWEWVRHQLIEEAS